MGVELEFLQEAYLKFIKKFTSSQIAFQVDELSLDLNRNRAFALFLYSIQISDLLTWEWVRNSIVRKSKLKMNTTQTTISMKNPLWRWKQVIKGLIIVTTSIWQSLVARIMKLEATRKLATSVASLSCQLQEQCLRTVFWRHVHSMFNCMEDTHKHLWLQSSWMFL